ncbi:MAG: DUF4184 family protein [Euryarchaeota archaeon]|nr:DUF4184 family protein [Euryarchaeota archaeon]
MPLTPFHAVVPWLPYARWPRAFSFWSLTLGAMVSDVEVLPAWALVGDIHLARGPMHSVFGVLTINAAITVVAVRFLVPPALRWFQRRWPNPGLLRFAGQDLRNDPQDFATIYSSAALGGLTHIIADIPTHTNNPVWWPWQTDPLALVPFADELWWDAMTTVAWLLVFLVVVRAYWRR